MTKFSVLNLKACTSLGLPTHIVINMTAKRIIVTGSVQGVGFRPFIARLAKECVLSGKISNNGSFVEIIISGSNNHIQAFLRRFPLELPPLAKVNESIIEEYPDELISNNTQFIIEESKVSNVRTASYIPADTAICDKCLQDLLKGDRVERKNYPFTSCVDCGPRYTIIKSLPYDRQTTTMNEFSFCSKCLTEYDNPLDRRFHAQTTCCSLCGPQYQLYDSNGIKLSIEQKDLLSKVNTLLHNGNIIAIKGIGGTHLACLPILGEPIERLRKSKGDRKRKPFALMSLNIAEIEKYAVIPNDSIKNVLLSPSRPIVLLPKRNPFPMDPNIAPLLHNVGTMLPYTGLHYLLLSQSDCHTLIMTSANKSHLPIQIGNDEIFKDLNGLVDYYLLHNRVIYQRADDSVVKPMILTNSTLGIQIHAFIRKSRGYVPEPLDFPLWNDDSALIGLGSELHTAGAIVTKKHLFLTQYLGNLRYQETYNYYRQAILHLKALLLDPPIKVLIGDLHPGYLSTEAGKEWSQQWNVDFVQIQHHYAHAGALLGEYGLVNTPAVIFTADGLGYGEDGAIWGGEFLKGSLGKLQRIAHWAYVPQPGGDMATHFPARMIISYLNEVGWSEEKIINLIEEIHGISGGITEIKIIIHQCSKRMNVPLTSSTGRFLDAVATLLGITNEATYEGEPAIVLEGLGWELNSLKKYANKNPLLKDNNLRLESQLDLSKYFEVIVQALERGMNKKELAYYVQTGLGTIASNICLEIAQKDPNIRYIGFTGGVSYNDLITHAFIKNVKDNGYFPLLHTKLPNGDGAISAGQCFYYIAKSKNTL